MKQSVLLYFLLVLAMPAVSQTVEEDIAAVRKLMADQQAAFNTGDLAGATAPFAEDAVVVSNGEPLIEGSGSMTVGYEQMLSTFDVDYYLTTVEIVHGGNIIYERGTYTLDLLDKASGEAVQHFENNHMHIFRRQADGSWKTWRMMYNTHVESVR
jgi:ketosteroid isomerase-like protein